MSRVLYGSNVQTMQWLRIDLATGRAAPIGPTAYKVDGLGGRLP